MSKRGRRRERVSRGRTRTLDAMPTFKATPSPSKESRPLFHYTTARGICGIIGTRSLFATHADFLNDSAECKILIEILLPQLRDEFAQLVPELIRIGALKSDVMTEKGTDVFEQGARQIIASVVRAIENISPFFVASFCMHLPASPEYQNGLLSQWRAYAQGGFAIEFDELQLDKLAAQENDVYRHQGILTRHVAYDSYADHVDLSKFEGLARAALSVVFTQKHLQEELKTLFGDRQFHEFVKPFLESLPFLKNFGFQEEVEYRMVALCNRPGVSAENETRLQREILFRDSAGGSVVPYITLFKGLDAKLPIKSIIIGPHQNQDNQEKALRLLLDQNEIRGVEIRKSAITFRA
jgi:hypothetical protein